MKNEIDLSYDILRSIDQWIINDADKNLIAMIIEGHINEYNNTNKKISSENYIDGCMFDKGKYD